MKKILITGAGGFIGSHLVEKCHERNLEVVAFVHYNSNGSLGWLERYKGKKELEIIRGDIRDYDSVSRAIKNCDTVFHLAALIGIPYSYISPLAYLRTNVDGTYNILEASRAESVENIMITSTSETYGTAQYIPIDEKHPLVGQSPYSASKIAADQLAISYFRSFELPVKLVRPFNTYGPRQSARAIIPTVILQLIHNRPLKLGNLSPTRDLTYVKDTVNAYLTIADNKRLIGEIVNIGMKKEISINDLILRIAGIMDKELRIESEKKRIRPKLSEVERLICDNTKLIDSTNWRPAFDLNSGLTETIDWIRDHLEKYNNWGDYNV